MGCRFAYFAEVDRSNGERVKTTAFWNGKKIDRNFEFAASGIAGEVLTSGKTVIYSKGLAGAYPEDVHARRLGADSFIGTPVFGASGEPLGFLAVSDDKPIPEEIVPQVQSVMTIAAARAGAEIERQRAYEELQVANGRLLDEHKAMMEKNIALQTILDHLERERMEYRRDICTSIDHALTPAIKKLRGREGIAGSRDLAALEDALDSIIGGGIDTFENNYHKLTPREAEICASIAQGRTSKEIADGLHLSVQTVHKHRESIRRKLQVQNLDINLSTFLRHWVR
jgi:DNA-binding CsgD family transcriptional regulator